MNKAQLIEQIAKDARITKKQANESLDSFTGAVVSTLKRGDTVTIVGFGTFSVTARAARNGIPRTGRKPAHRLKRRTRPALQCQGRIRQVRHQRQRCFRRR